MGDGAKICSALCFNFVMERLLRLITMCLNLSGLNAGESLIVGLARKPYSAIF
jgi:hypothetical protein